MDWYLGVWKKYAVFEGRARRQEYWMFFLVHFVVSLVIAVADELIGFGILAWLYSVAILVPCLAVTVRRLHDTNRSGWWLLIGLIPIVGAIVVFVFTVLDSDPQTNQYGPNPKTNAA